MLLFYNLSQAFHSLAQVFYKENPAFGRIFTDFAERGRRTFFSATAPFVVSE